MSAARRLAKRAFRTRERRFLAEGPQAVREAARRPGDLLEVFVTEASAQRYPDVLEAAAASGAAVVTVAETVIDALGQTVTPQGIVGVCRFVDVSLDSVVQSAPRLVTVLANVRDPGNAGTVIRTADAAGSDAVLLSESSVDVYNAKSVRASVGSVFHLPVVTAVELKTAVPRLRELGLRVLAADGAGTSDLDECIDSGALAQPTAWVFGNEAWGLPDDVLALCDDVVRVPIHGQAESLNLATAAAVCLYASAREQRRA